MILLTLIKQCFFFVLANMIIIVATWLSKVYFVNTVMVCSLCVGYFWAEEK